ncbi:hypothetical protein NKH80_15370 [Mesorhizobium sp. M0904]|uniref:hypothetical protein n=1 Tax=Mesorhizobium sp. M0904 TaxID=2957022 RepID=UPI003337BBB6
MQIFDRIDSLIDLDDCPAAIAEARALLLRFEQRSDALTHAIDDFLLDLITPERLPAEGWRRSDFYREESIPPGKNDAQSLLLTGYRAAFHHTTKAIDDVRPPK